MAQHDPLADLKAEIAAEEAALGEQEQTTQAEEIAAQAAEDARLAAEAKDDGEADGGEEDADKTAQAKVEDKEEKPEAKGKKTKAETDEERMVPASRLNSYAVENRKLTKQLETLSQEVEKLKNPPKPGEVKQLTPEQYREQVRAQERANIRLEMQLEEFVGAGNTKYTQKAFDAACDKINELIGGPSDLVAIAMEATGSPKAAADAVFLLGQNDAPEIEAFLALSPIKKAAHLAKLASARPSRAKTSEEDAPGFRPKRPKVEDDDEPPAPLRPIKGNARIPEGLGDDVPDDVWNERFEKQIMNKNLAH